MFYHLPLHRAEKTEALPVCCHFTNTSFCLSNIGYQWEKYEEKTLVCFFPPLTLFPLILNEYFMNLLCFVTLCAFQFHYLKKKKKNKGFIKLHLSLSDGDYHKAKLCSAAYTKWQFQVEYMGRGSIFQIFFLFIALRKLLWKNMKGGKTLARL